MERLHNVFWLWDYRKNLRINSTDAEAILWSRLKRKQLLGRKFRRQHSIGRYIVDFFCYSENLAIELDGEVHQLDFKKESDRVKSDFLEKEGIRVLRFDNEEVFRSIDQVIERIILEFRA